MRKQLITLIVLLAGAMIVSTMARAAGETKNEAPFTRLVAQGDTESRGEAKNELPFTATPGAIPDVFDRGRPRRCDRTGGASAGGPPR